MNFLLSFNQNFGNTYVVKKIVKRNIVEYFILYLGLWRSDEDLD